MGEERSSSSKDTPGEDNKKERKTRRGQQGKGGSEFDDSDLDIEGVVEDRGDKHHRETEMVVADMSGQLFVGSPVVRNGTSLPHFMERKPWYQTVNDMEVSAHSTKNRAEQLQTDFGAVHGCRAQDTRGNIRA